MGHKLAQGGRCTWQRWCYGVCKACPSKPGNQAFSTVCHAAPQHTRAARRAARLLRAPHLLG